MEKTDKIVYEAGCGEIIEKKSRFIANVFPVEREEEAEQYIEQIKKKHYDARHNCYAYIIGNKGEVKRYSDDGEPQGTAGKPMLEMLEKEGVTNCLVVVTRYFGGILLGTGGLLRAYVQAAKEGLNSAVVISRYRGKIVLCDTDYNSMGKIQYIAAAEGAWIIDTVYSEKVELRILVPQENYASFEKKVTEATNAKTGMELISDSMYGIKDGETKSPIIF